MPTLTHKGPEGHGAERAVRAHIDALHGGERLSNRLRPENSALERAGERAIITERTVEPLAKREGVVIDAHRIPEIGPRDRAPPSQHERRIPRRLQSVHRRYVSERIHRDGGRALGPISKNLNQRLVLPER